MNTNAKTLAGSGVFFFLWALATGAPIAWKLIFAWCSLVALLDLMLLYWSVNLSCSVELRPTGGNHDGQFEITYIFANNALIAMPACQVSIHLDKELGSLTFAPEMLTLSIGEIKTLRKRFRCPRRGIYSVGGATATFWDLLGIRMRNRHYDKQITVEVFPHKYPVESLLTSGCEEGGGLRGNWAAEHDFTSIRRIREAFPQESVRHVHWKASARTEELQIREYETRKRQGITIILDGNVEKYSNDSDGKIEERCVEVAAGLISHWLEKNYSVDLVTGSCAMLELKGTESMEAALRVLMVFKPEGRASLDHVVEAIRKGKLEGSVLQIVTPEISAQEAFSITHVPVMTLSLFRVGSSKGVFPEDLPMVEIPV